VQTSVSDALKAESTVVNFSMLNENDVINFSYGNPTFTTTLPSCTYTCTLNSGQTACNNNTEVFSIGLTAATCP
jgi:hypothetical protein